MSEVTERVAAGAAWLDEVMPGWFNDIDLSTMKIKTTCNCVLAQLVKDVDNEWGWLKEHPESRFDAWVWEDEDAGQVAVPDDIWQKVPAHLTYEEASSLGFVARSFDTTYEYGLLQDEWEQLINERRENAPMPEDMSPTEVLEYFGGGE